MCIRDRGIHDILSGVEFARKGGTLTMKQLLQIQYNVSIAGRVISFSKGSDLPPMPLLHSMIELLVAMPRLGEKIDRCILSEDEMSDNASPELHRIRRAIARQNDAIKNKLNQILGSQDNLSLIHI